MARRQVRQRGAHSLCQHERGACAEVRGEVLHADPSIVILVEFPERRIIFIFIGFIFMFLAGRQLLEVCSKGRGGRGRALRPQEPRRFSRVDNATEKLHTVPPLAQHAQFAPIAPRFILALFARNEKRVRVARPRVQRLGPLNEPARADTDRI